MNTKSQKPNLIIISIEDQKELAKYTLKNKLPVLLINLKDFTLIDKLISQYQEHVKSFHVIFSNEKHQKIIDSWIVKYHSEIEYESYIYSNNDGTRAALQWLLSMDQSLKTNSIIHSTDIILDNPNTFIDTIKQIQSNKHIDGVVITDNFCRHKLHFHDQKIINRIIRDEITKNRTFQGNLTNILYFKEIKFWKQDYFHFEDIDYLIDLKEQLQHSEIIIKDIKQDIHDISTVDRYESNLCEEDELIKTSNIVKEDNDTITKYAITQNDTKSMHYEQLFYIEGAKNSWPIPNVYSTSINKIVMEKLTGHTLKEYLNIHDVGRYNDMIMIKVISLFKQAIQNIHNTFVETTQYQIIKQHTLKEYVQEFDNAIIDIGFVLPKLGTSIMCKINDKNIEVKPYNLLKADWNNYLLKFMRRNFYYFHGNTNIDNCIIEKNKEDLNGLEMKFIDSSPIFGDMELIGDKYLDYAKFILGLHGYDRFVEDMHFKISVDENSKYHFDFNYGYSLDSIFKEFFITNVDKVYTGMLIGTLIMRNAVNLRSSPIKMVASYLYGSSLITHYHKQRVIQHRHLMK